MPITKRPDLNKAKDILNKDLVGVYSTGLEEIVEATPAVTGEARNGWFLSDGVSTRAGLTRPPNESGSGSKSSINSKMPKSVIGKKLFFTNNRPQIIPLEYGGYPDPVKNGSYDKQTKSYVKLSSGGFSLQAPKGWVRITLKRMQKALRAL